MDPSYNDSFGSFGSNGGGSFSQSPTISSGGDIVIGGGEKKKKKWIIWVIVAAFLVVGGVCGVILLTTLNNGGGSGVALDNLINYLESGEGFDFDLETFLDSSEEEIDEDLIYAVKISYSTPDIISEYYDGLSELEKKFFDNNNVSDTELLNEYKEALKVLRNAVDYEKVRGELVAAYDKDDKLNIETYINLNLSCDSSDTIFGAICMNEMRYYSAVLEKHVFFADMGCNDGMVYDMICAENAYGEENALIGFNSIESEDYYLNVLNESRVKTLLSNGVKRINKELLEGVGV